MPEGATTEEAPKRKRPSWSTFVLGGLFAWMGLDFCHPGTPPLLESAPIVHATEPLDADPHEILRQMVDVYSSCNSYQDTGVVRTTYQGSIRDHVSQLRFRTEFVRP